MRLFSLLIILILTCTLSRAQNESASQKDLDILYTQALNSDIAAILSSGWKYIYPDENGVRIKKLNVADRYKFLSFNELKDLSIKRKKTIVLRRVWHKIIDKDTIDINIEFIKYTAIRKIHFNNGLKFKKVEIEKVEDSTKDYEPDFRFSYNSETETWEMIFNRLLNPSD